MMLNVAIVMFSFIIYCTELRIVRSFMRVIVRYSRLTFDHDMFII